MSTAITALKGSLRQLSAPLGLCLRKRFKNPSSFTYNDLQLSLPFKAADV